MKVSHKSLFAGFGGQGIISMGQIWVYLGMKEGKNVTFFPFYGAEKRGGIARAGVIISDDEIASPLVTTPDSVVVMNSDSLSLCEGIVKEGGLMLVNSSLVKESPKRKDVNIVNIEASALAEKAGHIRYANMVALGALIKITGFLKLADIDSVLKGFFSEDKHKFIPENVQAIRAGMAII